METLEKLLSQPLQSIPDNGFSLKILEKINHYQTLRFRILCALYCFLGLILAIFFPIKQVIQNTLVHLISYSQTASQLLLPTTYSEITLKSISMPHLVQNPLAICTIMIFIYLFLRFSTR
jgi:hypothetical protein